MASFAGMLDYVLDKDAAGIRIEAERRPVLWGEDGPRYSDLPILTTADVDVIIEAVTTPADRKVLTSHGNCEVRHRHGRTAFTCSILTQYEYSVTFRLSQDALLELSTAEHLSLVDDSAPPAGQPPPAEPRAPLPAGPSTERAAASAAPRRRRPVRPACPPASTRSCRGWSTTMPPICT